MSENTCGFSKALERLVEGAEGVDVGAALAQRRGAAGQAARSGVPARETGEPEGRAHEVGVELAGPRQLAGHAAP